MSAKVSFVIIVYNVEDYAEQCARSIFEQSLEDIEIIIVNDASTDNTEAVIRRTLEEYPNRNGQVRFVEHETNKGIVETRKDGFYAATGEFVIFIDGDDYVEPQMAELMYAKATETGADLVVCDYLLQEVAKEIVISQVPNGVIGYGENVRDDIINRRVTCTIWCKMIRRSLFLDNDIVWPANVSHEDMVMSDMAAYYARQFAHVPIPLYHYVYRSNSVSNIVDPEFVVWKMELYKDNIRVIKEFFEREGVSEKYAEGLLTEKVLARNLILPYTNKLKYRRIWLRTYPEVNRILLFGNKEYRSTYREKIWMMAIWLGLYPRMKRRLLSKRFKPDRIWSLMTK
jgi:glycosyltransferase involved in cell wall biosynthesis